MEYRELIKFVIINFADVSIRLEMLDIRCKTMWT